MRRVKGKTRIAVVLQDRGEKQKGSCCESVTRKLARANAGSVDALLGLATLLNRSQLATQRIEGVARGLISVDVVIAVDDELGAGDGQLDAHAKGAAVALMVRRRGDDDAQRM